MQPKRSKAVRIIVFFFLGSCFFKVFGAFLARNVSLKKRFARKNILDFINGLEVIHVIFIKFFFFIMFQKYKSYEKSIIKSCIFNIRRGIKKERRRLLLRLRKRFKHGALTPSYYCYLLNLKLFRHLKLDFYRNFFKSPRFRNIVYECKNKEEKKYNKDINKIFLNFIRRKKKKVGSYLFFLFPLSL